MVGLGEAEAADDLALGQPRQIFLPLRLAAIGVDRMHDQRGLHRHRRAVAGIDALELARDQPIGDIAHVGAAVLLREGAAEKAERRHLADDLAVEALLAVGGEHARKQLVLRIGARGVAHHALVLGELAFEVERIVPAGRWLGAGGFRLVFLGGAHAELLLVSAVALFYTVRAPAGSIARRKSMVYLRSAPRP